MSAGLRTIIGLLCVPFTLGLFTLPAGAQKIWDDELRRYLTEEEMNHAEAYLTEEEAVTLMFPQSQHIRREVLRLTADQKAMVKKRIGWDFPEETFEVYIGETKGHVDGYALVQNTIGKYKPMTYMVGVAPNGEVLNVEVLVYRETRGSEVRTKRFNYQYEGKTVFDPIRINRDIINITGATMSVRSMSAGVKRVLVLVDEFYLKPIGRGSDTMEARSRSKGFFEKLFGF